MRTLLEGLRYRVFPLGIPLPWLQLAGEWENVDAGGGGTDEGFEEDGEDDETREEALEMIRVLARGPRLCGVSKA